MTARVVLLILLAVSPAASQTAAEAPRRDVARVYAEICAACHGPRLEGGKAQSLVDDVWVSGGTDADLQRTIADGRPEAGMPAFRSLLTEPEIRAMVYYLREARVSLLATPPPRPAPIDPSVLHATTAHRFRLELVADGLSTPWGMAFLPDGRLIVSERNGHVRLVEIGKPLPPPVGGTPRPWVMQDGGLMDVALHPAFAENGWIYLAYSEPGPPPTSTTTIVRGRIRNGQWVEQQTIHQAPPSLYVADNTHFGARFLFDGAGHLFFSLGDRGTMADAQLLTTPNGKIHRVLDDGAVPADNPFVGTAGAVASIWSLGNRNPQGLAWHPVTGALWSSEHGPRGGDEINLIERGLNYGWPAVTDGINYDGSPISSRTAAPGLASPIVTWTPSVAPSGIAFYTGDKFPRWKNDLFVALLAGQSLRRLKIEGRAVAEQETIVTGYGRVRHVINGPDGLIYVALNDPGRIVRLVPVD